MDEQFRPIEGYPGYRVTRDGTVESCWSRHARPARMTETWVPLRPIARPGCCTVNLSAGGRKKQCRIHRLVLIAFVGPPPAGMIACHSDGDPTNNDLANLRWDTPQANADDAFRHGTRAVGSRCHSKLTEGDVLEIRRLRPEGVPTAELASRFGVTKKNIEAIVDRRSWRHLPEGHVSISGSADPEVSDDRPGAAA